MSEPTTVTTPRDAGALIGGLGGRTVVITGGGRGIGRAFALGFATAGANVAIADIDDASARSVAAEIGKAGGKALAVRTDVSDEASVAAMAKTVTDSFGRIDVLINNAALHIDLERRKFFDIPFEEWDRVLRVNASGAFLCAKAVAPGMIANGFGRIISMSSDTVLLGVPMFAHYVASKGAIVGMTRAMARELGGTGVTANAIMPGLTPTEVDNPNFDETALAMTKQIQCIPRNERPADLVGTALFLASPAAEFITGQTMVVNGGACFV